MGCSSKEKNEKGGLNGSKISASVNCVSNRFRIDNLKVQLENVKFIKEIGIAKEDLLERRGTSNMRQEVRRIVIGTHFMSLCV